MAQTLDDSPLTFDRKRRSSRWVTTVELSVIAVALIMLSGAGAAQGLIPNGGEGSGTLAVVGQVDTWTFNGKAGTTATITLTDLGNDPLFSAVATLMAPNGTNLGSVSASSVGQQFFQNLPQSGSYTLLVRATTELETNRGSYMLRVVTPPGPFAPPPDEGGPMANAADQVGTITPGDVDLWRASAQAGDWLTFTIAETSPDPLGQSSLAVRIWAPDGTYLDTAAGHVAGQTWVRAPATGSYTVAVLAHANGAHSVGNYIVRFTKTPGAFNVPLGDDGGSLTNGGNHSGRLTLGDLDLWTFPANAGDTLTLSIAETSADPDNQNLLTLRLYSPDGTPLGLAGGHYAGQATFQQIASTGPTTSWSSPTPTATTRLATTCCGSRACRRPSSHHRRTKRVR